jgi:hypothetical protein
MPLALIRVGLAGGGQGLGVHDRLPTGTLT